MKPTQIKIECSPEQMEVIADYFLEDKQLGMQPDERVWMLKKAREINPAYRILGAELDEYKGEWLLTVTTEPRP
jgi:hypothetical protein